MRAAQFVVVKYSKSDYECYTRYHSLIYKQRVLTKFTANIFFFFIIKKYLSFILYITSCIIVVRLQSNESKALEHIFLRKQYTNARNYGFLHRLKIKKLFTLNIFIYLL